jgi:hypothetical protein
MDQLLVDAGVPWPMRRMAKSMKYGVGKNLLTVSQNDDAIDVVTEMPTRSPVKTSFRVGKSEWQETVAVDDKPILVKAAWEDNVLVLERRKMTGQEMPVVRRWLDPTSEDLIEEVVTSTGGKVLRVFTKQ